MEKIHFHLTFGNDSTWEKTKTELSPREPETYFLKFDPTALASYKLTAIPLPQLPES
jgi:hypothetical protein